MITAQYIHIIQFTVCVSYWCTIIRFQSLRETYNNFNSYLAILSAIESSAISRLDWPEKVIKVRNVEVTVIHGLPLIGWCTIILLPYWACTLACTLVCSLHTSDYHMFLGLRRTKNVNRQQRLLQELQRSLRPSQATMHTLHVSQSTTDLSWWSRWHTHCYTVDFTCKTSLLLRCNQVCLKTRLA